MQKITYVIFHSEHPLHLVGQNSGAENATLELSYALKRQGHRVIVAANLIDSNECIKNGVEFLNFGENYNIASIFEKLENIEDYILMSACRGLPIFLSQNKQNCKKRFLICHEPLGNAFGVKTDIVSRVCDGIISVSEAQKNLIVESGGDKDKIKVIYSGVNSDRYKPYDSSKRDFNRIVFVGALVGHKGVDILINSFIELLKKYPDIKLDIYGSAKLWGKDEYLNQKQISSLVPQIKFHGAVSQDEIANVFKEAGICVIPSRYFDSFPLTAVEAQVSGCPVVCFDVGGIKECVQNGKSGVVINAVSIDGLTSNLDLLLSNKEKLREFSDYAAKTFYKIYNWDNTAKEFISYTTKDLNLDIINYKINNNIVENQNIEPSKKIKIGFMTTWNQPCGIAKYASFLLSEFKGYDITILAEEREDADLSQDKENVIRCWNRDNKDFSKLIEVIKATKIDVLYVYFHPLVLNNEKLLKNLKDLKKDGLKIITHAHNSFDLSYRNCYSIADKVFVHQEENKLLTMSGGIREDKITVLPLGMKEKQKISNERRQEVRKSLNIDNDEKLILTFGFIQSHKGQEGVIEAVRFMRSINAKVKGVIVGSIRKDDPRSEGYYLNLKQLIEKFQLENYVTIINDFVPDETLDEYIQSSDLVILNYKTLVYENSGALNLALSNGAVVATSLSPIFNWYKNTIWRVNVNFPIGLSASILIYNQEVREYLLKNGKNFIKSNSFEVASNIISCEINKLFKDNLYLQNNESQLAIKKIENCKENTKENTMISSYNNNQKKILFVIRNNAFTQRGGDTVLMERLREALIKKGFIVDICEDRDKTDFSKYDIVHLFNFVLPQDTTDAGVRASKANVPFVVTTLFEDFEVYYNQSVALTKFFVNYYNNNKNPDFFRNTRKYIKAIPSSGKLNVVWLCEYADALLTSGKSESDNIIKSYNPKARVYESHYGLNMTLKGDKERFYQKYGIKDFVFCVGRFEVRKNQLMLLKALEDVDIPVVLASGGFSYQADYNHFVRNFKRKGKTVILEKLDLQDLADAYAACKVHALASFYELPGLVSLEAANYGANVVVTDYGSIRDYLGDLAFYCDPYNTESIKNAVIAAYYAPVDPRLKQKVSEYSWDRCADETIKAYKDIFIKYGKENSNQIQSNDVQNNYQQVSTLKDGISNNNDDNVCENVEISASKIFDNDFTNIQEIKFNEAIAFAEQFDFQKALDIFYSLEDEIKSSLKLYRSIGATLLAKNDYDESKRYFEKALTIDPNDIKSVSGLGICMLRLGDCEDAMQMFKKSLSLDPYNTVVILQLVECAYSINKFDELKDALEKYLDKFENNLDMKFSLAGVYYKLGMYDDANKCLDYISMLAPNYKGISDFQEKIDAEYKQNNNYNNVIESDFDNNSSDTYQTKTEIIENNNLDLQNSSYMYNKIDSIDEKIACLEEAKKRRNLDEFEKGVDELMQNSSLNDKHREYVNTLKAESLMLKGDNNSALEILEQVINKNPNSYKAIADFGILMATSGNWDEARKNFDDALKINCKYDVALSGIGLCYSNQGDFEKAYDYYKKSLDSNPENVRALLGIIDLSYKLSRLDELEQILKNYLDLHPADLNFLYTLAACYYGKSEFQKSLDTISQILLFDENNKNALELKNMILEKIQNDSNVQI
ncbi:MAG: glycosyltransferase [Bdellovibrionota bacterium]|nr:glycosyltransferase [Bdellovibrionota bacterium]